MKITMKGLDAANAQVRAAVTDGVQIGLSTAGARAEFLVKQNVTHPFGQRSPAVSTGNLANSISFKISQEQGLSRAVVFAGAPADVYVDPVEFGSKAHMPPVNALLLWVERKFHPADEKAALKIAWAIAKNISKRGMPAFQMFARAFTVLETELNGIFTVAITNACKAGGLVKK